MTHKRRNQVGSYPLASAKPKHRGNFCPLQKLRKHLNLYQNRYFCAKLAHQPFRQTQSSSECGTDLSYSRVCSGPQFYARLINKPMLNGSSSEILNQKYPKYNMFHYYFIFKTYQWLKTTQLHIRQACCKDTHRAIRREKDAVCTVSPTSRWA